MPYAPFTLTASPKPEASRTPALHATGGCSNGPTEALNLLVQKVK
jgi:hypothetical protein